MNSSISGCYPRPLHLFQQFDFSPMPVSSYSDIANSVNTTGAPQSNSVNHHIVPVPPLDSISINANLVQSVASEYTASRPAPDYFMPSVSAFSDSGGSQEQTGNFSHFQNFSNHMLFHENSYHNGSSKVPRLSKPWFSSTQRNDEAGTANETSVGEDAELIAKPCKKTSKKTKEKKGKAKRVRYIKPGCSDQCRRRCKQKIPESTREDLFNKYWNLDDDNKKKEFIAQNAIKMPMMKCKEGSRRSFSVDWAFGINGESFSVCKLFFLHTLDIPENTAYAAIKDSNFFNSDAPIIKGKALLKNNKAKCMWFETDLDDYSVLERKGKYSRRTRCETFTKRDKFSEMRSGCRMCRRNCQTKFTYQERLAIFNEYRGLSNIRKQRDYISKYIHRMERKRIRAGESTRRNCSIQWNLPLKGKEIPVCKTFFLHTIGISERSAYNIGVQNEIKPVERKVKRPRKTLTTHFLSFKGKSFSSIIAKGKLKSALIISRKKQKKKVENEISDTEDVNDDHNIDSGIESCKKGKSCKQRDRKQKNIIDKTFKLKKGNLEKASSVDENVNESSRRKVKGRSGIKISTLFKLPIKKKETMKCSIPVLRIKKGKIISMSKKRRNPYKRKEMPTKSHYNLCPEDCKKSCRQSICEELRREIFSEFWGLKNMEEQRKYISKCVKKIARPTCACLVTSHLRGKRRGYKITWNLIFRDVNVPVCKMFFMHVLQISDSVVYKAVREDHSFIADDTLHPCKHFTGQSVHTKPTGQDVSSKPTGKNTNSKPMGLNVNSESVSNKHDQSELIKTDVCENASENSFFQKESKIAGNFLMNHSVGDKSKASDVHSLDLTRNKEKSCVNVIDKDECQSQVMSSTEANILNSGNHFNNGTQHGQKLHFSMQHATQNGLCSMEANYETLIPCLNIDHSPEADQSLPLHFQNSQIVSFAQNEKARNMFNTTLPPLHNLPNCNQTELWHKPPDSFHPMFASTHPVFPMLPDNLMEPVHNMAHSRCFPSHFTFQQTNGHHAHFPSQSSSAHHSSSFSQLHSTLTAPPVIPGHAGFSNNLTGNFYHSSRFHNFGPPANVPRECVAGNSDYPIDNSHQAYQESCLVPTIRNSNIDLLLPNTSKHKVKKNRKKPCSTLKPKHIKLKESGAKKKKERKPFNKQVKAGCLESCKRKCSLKIPHEAREQIFSDFWNLENDTRRREYVLPIVNKVPKKTCSGSNSRRCCTIEWTIPYGSEKHVVCKRFFLDTFDIGEKFVKTVFDKLERKGGSMEDMRGRHCKRSNVFVREQEEIEKHIRSVSALKTFQCISCKKDFTSWCLEPGIIVSHLYKMYADQRKLEGVKPACRTSYTDICTKKFNLKSCPSQENVCDLCSVNIETPHAAAPSLNAL